MTQQEVFGNALWVEADESIQIPVFRKVFEAGKVTDAKIEIIGLGVFALFINGQRVSNDLLVPVVSDYHERKFAVDGLPFDEVLGHRMYVCQYDVTEYLQEKKNALAIMLGPAWYADKHHFTFGRMKLCFRLTYTDDTGIHEVLSDENMTCSRSFVLDATLLEGEKHNYFEEQEGWMEPEFDDGYWHKVSLAKAPNTEFYMQECPPDREIRRIMPKFLGERNGLKLYDVGENISGYVVLQSKGGNHVGDAVVTMSEELLPDGSMDTFRGYGQKLDYIVGYAKKELRPYFTWQGFRYFEVWGDVDVVDCRVVHADIAVSSTFDSSNEVLNWLNDAYIRTQLCNIHMGIPSDCPHAERKGYTGDGQLTCEAGMLTLDSRKFYEKWIADISDCQDRITGHVQYTAPYNSAGGGPGGWGCAIVVVPYMYYKQYGDVAMLRNMYDQMLKYLGYLKAHSENHLVVSDRKNGWCLGDWCTAEKTTIPEPFVNTYFFVKSIDYVLEIAQIIGRTEYVQDLIALRKTLCKAITDTYFDKNSGDFAGNYQGSNAYALDIGLGDERTLANMVRYYRELGMYDTGIFGTDILTRVLFEKGEADLAYGLLTSKGKYSFYHIMEQNATTLWEYWTGDRSHSHPMFGAVCKCLYQNILGIQQTEDSCGYSHIRIAPAQIRNLSWASGSIETVCGQIRVERRTDGEDICFTVTLPENVEAEFTYGNVQATLHGGENCLKIPV